MSLLGEKSHTKHGIRDSVCITSIYSARTKALCKEELIKESRLRRQDKHSKRQYIAEDKYKMACELKKNIIPTFEYIDPSDFYGGCYSMIRMRCSAHGDFTQKRNNHIHSLERGCSGCDKCRQEKASAFLREKASEEKKSIYDCQEQLNTMLGGYMYQLISEEICDGKDGFRVRCLLHQVTYWVDRTKVYYKYCGCKECRKSKRSSGERLVEKICIELGLDYNMEEPLHIPQKKTNNLRFDVFINPSIALEIQGLQHFPKKDVDDYSEIQNILMKGNYEDYHSKYDSYIHTSPQRPYGHFLANHHRDEIKRHYCIENGITLLYYIDKKTAKQYPKFISRLIDEGSHIITNEDELKQVLVSIKNNAFDEYIKNNNSKERFQKLVETYYKDESVIKYKYKDPKNIEFVKLNATHMSDSRMAYALSVNSKVIKRIRYELNIPIYHKGRLTKEEKEYIDRHLGKDTQKKIASDLGIKVAKIERYVKETRPAPFCPTYKKPEVQASIIEKLDLGMEFKDITKETGYSIHMIRSVIADTGYVIHTGWTRSELEILKANINEPKHVLLALLSEKSYGVIHRMKIKILGHKVRKMDLYTEEEDQIIRDCYRNPSISVEGIIQKLGNKYSKASVYKRAEKLNLKRPPIPRKSR